MGKIPAVTGGEERRWQGQRFDPWRIAGNVRTGERTVQNRGCSHRKSWLAVLCERFKGRRELGRLRW